MARDTVDVLDQLERLQDFAKRLLDPEDLGHAITGEVRRAAREALRGDARSTNPYPTENRR